MSRKENINDKSDSSSNYKVAAIPPPELDAPEIIPLKEEMENNQVTMKEPLSTSATLIQIAVSSAVSLMHLAAGVAFGYTGVILPSITDPDSDDIYMTTKEVSIYTSILLIGSFIGSLVSGPISIRYGQRVGILLIIPLSVVGWIISFFAKSFWLHLVSRLILGIFASCACGISVTYIAETVHPSLRARLMAISDLGRQTGFFYVFLIGSSDMNWRIVGLVCGLTPLLIPGIVCLFIPNSPRWSSIKDRPEDEIKTALRFFQGRNHNVDPEYKEIQDDVQKAKKSSTTWQQIQIMKEKSLVKRLIVLIYLNVAINLTGNVIVISYSVSIFQSASTGISPYLSTVICGAMRIIGSLLYMVIADRFGRKFIGITFFTLGGLSTTGLGIYFYLKSIEYDTSSISWLPLLSLILFTLFTCMAHPVVRLLRSELLPNTVRSLGVNFLYFVFFVGSFIVTLIYPFMVQGIGAYWVFWIFSINSIMMSIVIFIFLPETKGKTLEEIAALF